MPTMVAEMATATAMIDQCKPVKRESFVNRSYPGIKTSAWDGIIIDAGSPGRTAPSEPLA